MVDKNKYAPGDELTTRLAATEAEVDRRTIVAWIHAGTLRATQRPGKRGHYRVRWADLYEVLHKQVVPKQRP